VSQYGDPGANSNINDEMLLNLVSDGTLQALSGNSSNIGLPKCSVNYPGSIRDGVWQNITFSMNNGIGVVYVNGKQIGTLSGCVSSFTPTNIYIASSDQSGDDFWVGYIDDVYIYTQSLSLNQVQQLYALGAAKHGLTVR
jgi:hypothetical protein